MRPDVLIRATSSLPAAQLTALAALRGVSAALPLAGGTVHVGAASVHAVGVDPVAFRAWTPALTAGSAALWQSVAAGEATASFDAAQNLSLPLGSTLALHGAAGPTALRLGALASTGLPGVDLTVSLERGHALGLHPASEVLLAAPGVDLTTLIPELRARLGPDVQVLLLHALPVVRDPGAFLTRAQLTTALHTALSTAGTPYVWGATGPASFDCSGLVGYAYAAAGVALPRTSEQLWLSGPHIAASDARPGDLLFWANDPAAPTTSTTSRSTSAADR